ncbi:MAG: hypothetical protein LBT10_04990 [Methanobrevibacter sp.]|nr:hypothetical protein [Methanobrevibacter sp.]
MVLIKLLNNEFLGIDFTDGTPAALEVTILYIKNYNGGDIYVNFWDRGTWRYPHIDVIYNGQYKDGGQGHDVTFE